MDNSGNWIDAGAQLGSAAMQIAGAYGLQTSQVKKAKQLADYSNEKAKELYNWQIGKYRDQMSYMWENYESPEARRRALEAAGYSADMLSEGGSGGSGGNLGMPQSSFSSPDPSLFEGPSENINQAFNRVTQAAASIGQFFDMRDTRMHEKEMRRQSEEAGKLDLLQRKVSFLNTLDDYNFKPTQRLRDALRFDEEQKGWKRSARRFDFDLDRDSFDLQEKKATAPLLRLLLHEDYNEKHWQNSFRQNSGYEPSTKPHSNPLYDLISQLLLGVDSDTFISNPRHYISQLWKSKTSGSFKGYDKQIDSLMKKGVYNRVNPSYGTGFSTLSL